MTTMLPLPLTTPAPYWHRVNDMSTLLVVNTEEARIDGIPKTTFKPLGHVQALTDETGTMYYGYARTPTEVMFFVRARADERLAQKGVEEFVKDMGLWPVEHQAVGESG